MWGKDLKCKFCKHEFHVTELDINYADLQNPEFFTADYQYYVVCPECEQNLILGNLPSSVAIEVQNRIYAD